MTRPTYLKIDLHALDENLARVRALAPQSAVIAMVKANAYGHGLVTVAKALTSANAFGVACIDEAIMLREAGINAPIVLMEGVFNSPEMQEVVQHKLTPVIHHEAQVAFLEEAKISQPINIWMKINSGMNRLGIKAEQFPKLLQRVNGIAGIIKPVGLMTHFAEADDLQSAATDAQIKVFNDIVKDLHGPRSLANSAAILTRPLVHADWVRPGLMLYGASPFPNTTGLDYGLQPVMTLSSSLIAIHHLKKGEAVGYGGTWHAPDDCVIGVVAAGYGDGYPQYTKNGTHVLVNDQCCELVGRVSMDMLTVDLSHAPNAKINDPVVLWGRGLPIEQVAIQNNTSAYELMTRMTNRPKVQLITPAKVAENVQN